MSGFAFSALAARGLLVGGLAQERGRSELRHL
jgi:hypothetical protein